MKKTLLTFGAAAAFVASAYGQASIFINNPASAGFNTATSDPNSLTGWFTGNISLEVWTIPAAENFSLATTINNYAASAATVQTAINLVQADFTPQGISSQGGSLNTEAPSQTFQIADGSIFNEGSYEVGTASSLPESTPVFFALLALTTTGTPNAGVIVLDNSSSGYVPAAGPLIPPNVVGIMWPADQQNVLLVPEPATLALAGLGGFSIFFRRRLRAKPSSSPA
jgi:PEP-CTERM motif